MSTIGIVGVTGNVGSRIAGMLAGAHDVVGIARNPDGAPEGVRKVSADLRDAAQAREALTGLDALYLTPPEAGEDPLALEREVSMTVVDAARANGIGHVVVHTAVHADRGDTGARVLDNKTAIEEALAGSGLGYTILRPAWYLQNLWPAKEYLAQGMFSMPWPAGMTWAATDLQDLANAAAAFLQHGPANRAFDVHVPGGITAQGIGEAVEAITGTQVGYQAAPSSRDAVEPYPIGDKHKEIYAELYDYFKSTTYLGDPEPIMEALPGFSYSSVGDFMRRELFADAG